MSTLVRIAATPWMETRAEFRHVAALAASPHQILRRLTAPSLAPDLTPRLAAPPALAALLGSLRGRVAVTNPCAAARLPRGLDALARGALQRALLGEVLDGEVLDGEAIDAEASARTWDVTGLGGTARRDARDVANARRLRAFLAALPAEGRDTLAPGRAAWGAVALYEPTTLDVRLPLPRTAPVAPDPAPAVAAPNYRLTLVVGRGTPPADWAPIDAAAAGAPAAAWPVGGRPMPWFVRRVLVSDAVVARAMDPSTLARWAALTGRAGSAAGDMYWFAETWERFREPGRRVGHVTPADVARSRRPTARVTLAGAEYAPAAERGVPVPPGYCLVDCAGALEIAVVAA